MPSNTVQNAPGCPEAHPKAELILQHGPKAPSTVQEKLPDGWRLFRGVRIPPDRDSQPTEGNVPNLDPDMAARFEGAKMAGRQPLLQPEAGTFTAQNGLHWQSDPTTPTQAQAEAAEWARVQRW